MSTLGFGFGVGCSNVSGEHPSKSRDGTHLLVDEEIFVVVFDVELPRNLLQPAPLLEDLLLQCDLVASQQLSSPDLRHQIASLLELLSQLLQLLCHLGISTARLAGLTDLATSEAHVWIVVVRLKIHLELEIGDQRAVVFQHALVLPVAVDVLCEPPRRLTDGLVILGLELLERKNGRVVYACIWLLGVRCFLEEVHNLFEIVLRTLRCLILVAVVGLKEGDILTGHAVWASYHVLYGGREADVRLRLREPLGVEVIIPQRAGYRFWCGDVELLRYFGIALRCCLRRRDDSLQMMLLCALSAGYSGV